MNTNMAKTLVEQGPVDLQAPVGAKQDDAAPQNTQEGGIFDGRAAMGIGLLIILVAMWILGYITGTDVETLLSLTICGVMRGGIIALGGIGRTLCYGVLQFPTFADEIGREAGEEKG